MYAMSTALSSPFRRWFSTRLLLLTIVFMLPNPVMSQTINLPENIQAALLEKVLRFDSRLGDKESIKMLILYDSKSKVRAERQKNALPSYWDVSLYSDLYAPGDLSQFDLVYFMPGTEFKANLVKEYGILSVSGVPAYVKTGLVSMAFGLENDKPKIFMSISSLKRENHSFSAEILRIVKVNR